MWRQDPSYLRAVESAWQQPGDHVSHGNILGHLEELGRSLSDWDHVTFGSVRKKLARTTEERARIDKRAVYRCWALP